MEKRLGNEENSDRWKEYMDKLQWRQIKKNTIYEEMNLDEDKLGYLIIYEIGIWPSIDSTEK